MGTAQEGYVADPRAHHQRIIQPASASTAKEHLCMQVAARVVECAKTELSQDGKVLLGDIGLTSTRTVKPSEHWKIFVRYSDFGHPRSTKPHGANREGGSDLCAGRRSARDLPAKLVNFCS